MAVREQAQVDIQLSNGKQAGETLNELTASSVKLNREIKNLKPGSDDFVKKTEEYQKVTQRLKEVKGQVYGVRQANQSLLGSFKQFLPFNAQMSTFGNTIGTVKTNVSLLSKGTNILKTAMYAIPIFLIIGAFTTLVAWFKKTQKGIEFINKVSAGLGAAFDVLIDRVTKFGGGLFKLFTGDVKGGLADLKGSFVGIGEEILNETNLAVKLRAALDRILETEIDLRLERSASRKEVKELNKIGEDTTKSFQKRSEAIAEAIKIEQDLLDKQIENQNKKAANMLGLFKITDEQLENIRKNGLKLEDIGISESLVKDKAAASDEIAKIFDLQTESLELQTTLNNKLNILETQRQKQREEELKVLQQERELREAFANRDQEITTKQVENQQIVTDAKAISMQNALNLQKELNAQAVEDEKTTADLIRKINQETSAQREAALVGSLAVTSSVAGQMASLFEEGSKEYKAFATLQALTDTIASAIAAFKSTAAIPIVGPALAPIAAASALAFGMANVRKIQSLKKDSKSASPATASTPRSSTSASTFSSYTPSSPVNPLVPTGSGTSGSQAQQSSNVNVNVGLDPVANEIKGLREDLQSGKIVVNQNLQDVNKGLKVLNNLDNQRRS